MVSVIVPSFRMARFLPEMLDSTLSQDYRPLEVIVADGGSDDGTVDILRDYATRHPELRWISEPDEGPADAVNKGLAMARGAYAVIQNADDLFRTGALSNAVPVLEAHPEASFVYGDIEIVDENGVVTYVRRFPDFTWAAFFALSCTVAQSSVMFRTAVARDIGGWNGRYYGCDLDFWLRLAFRGSPVHLPKVLSAWRRYEGQRTREDQFERIWHDYCRMIDDSADLPMASRRLRRLARASCHLLALRYYPPQRRWTIRGHMLLGLALHPTACRHLPWQLLANRLPGASWLQSMRNRWRRAMPDGAGN